MSASKINKATDSMLEDEKDSREIAAYLQERECNMSDEDLLKVMEFSMEDIQDIKKGEKGRRS